MSRPRWSSAGTGGGCSNFRPPVAPRSSAMSRRFLRRTCGQSGIRPGSRPPIHRGRALERQSLEGSQVPASCCAALRRPLILLLARFHAEPSRGRRPRDIWTLGFIQACDVNDCNAKLFAEHWNGSAWRTVPVPVRVGGDWVTITDMEAASARAVWAVGYDHEGPRTQWDFVVRWDGLRWSGVRSRFPVVDSTGTACAETWLSGVATPQSNDVWAVGGSEIANGASMS